MLCSFLGKSLWLISTWLRQSVLLYKLPPPLIPFAQPIFFHYLVWAMRCDGKASAGTSKQEHSRQLSLLPLCKTEVMASALIAT